MLIRKPADIRPSEITDQDLYANRRRFVQGTVAAVERQPGIGLRPDQASTLERIYHAVALDTYDRVVAVVNRNELDEAAKEAEVKRLVIAGQERSTAQVAEVLDAEQYRTYRVWEEKQVAAFRERGLWSGGRRARRGRS